MTVFFFFSLDDTRRIMRKRHWYATSQTVGRHSTGSTFSNDIKNDSTSPSFPLKSNRLNHPSNEIGKESDSRRPSLFSQGDAGEPRPQVSVSVPLQPSVMTTPPQNTRTFYAQPITSLPEQAANPRYTSNQFRTPQIPSSASGHVLGSSPTSNFAFYPK